MSTKYEIIKNQEINLSLYLVMYHSRGAVADIHSLTI